MIKQTLTACFLVTIMTITCKSKQSNEVKALQDELANIMKVDSASETTMLNPKFDANKLCGFGIFKIGNSLENTITYLLSTKTYGIDSFSSREQKMKFDFNHVSNNRKYIIKINPPKSTLDQFDDLENSSWCKDTKVFLLTKYVIDNITLDNLVATYYKDKLVKVSCEWSMDLSNAIESKYGKPDKKIADENLTPPIYSTYWYNQDIEAWETSLETLKFNVGIKGGDRFLFGCSDRDFQEQDKIDKANNKEKLKNF